MKEWTFWEAVFCGAFTGFIVYIIIWVVKIGHAFIWGY